MVKCLKLKKNQVSLWLLEIQSNLMTKKELDKDTGGTATVGYAVEAAEADELTAFVKLLG